MSINFYSWMFHKIGDFQKQEYKLTLSILYVFN